jgi:hypothetical protein
MFFDRMILLLFRLYELNARNSYRNQLATIHGYWLQLNRPFTASDQIGIALNWMKDRKVEKSAIKF